MFEGVMKNYEKLKSSNVMVFQNGLSLRERISSHTHLIYFEFIFSRNMLIAI